MSVLAINGLGLALFSGVAAAQDAELLEELEFVAWMLAMEDSDESSTSG